MGSPIITLSIKLGSNLAAARRRTRTVKVVTGNLKKNVAPARINSFTVISPIYAIYAQCYVVRLTSTGCFVDLHNFLPVSFIKEFTKWNIRSTGAHFNWFMVNRFTLLDNKETFSI